MTQEPVIERFHHGLSQFAGSQRTMRQEDRGLAWHISQLSFCRFPVQMLSGYPGSVCNNKN